jgi:hypothetical protein
MAAGNKPHSLNQGAPLWSANYGQVQLRPPPNPQKIMFSDQGLTLPLGLVLSLVRIGCHVNQTQKLCLGRISGLACNHKLTFEEGDLSSHLASLRVSRRQQNGILLGHLLTLGSRHHGGHSR